TLTRLGHVVARQQRWSEARTLFERSLVVRPNDAYTLAAAGEMACRLEEHAAAAEPLRRAVTLDATKPVPQFYLAVSLDRLGHHAEAMQHAQRAVALAPGNEEVRQFVTYLENRARGEEFARLWAPYLGSPAAYQPSRMTA